VTGTGQGGKIIKEAGKLFDAAGLVPLDTDSVLIVGIATSPDQDLDDFLRDENRAFITRGFQVYLQPKLEAMVESLHELGLSSEIWGPSGYPRGGELNLKRQAVEAGLGLWGKNSMLLHSVYGARLRLAAIKIVGASLECTGPGSDGHRDNPLCRDCNMCVNICPAGVLEPYYVWDAETCLANTSHAPVPGKVVCCDRCWSVCPVGIPGLA
jgi:epoxyqueuosine reductase QueG